MPENRKYQMRFEDLMSRPQEITKALCQRFGLAFHLDLLKPLAHPQANSEQGSTSEPILQAAVKGAKMPAGMPTANAFRTPIFENEHLSDITWEIAETFGYRRETTRPVKKGDGNHLQRSMHLLKRNRFSDQQRQRRMAHRKCRVQGGKAV
jgi:hypothetical protein